MNKIKFEIIDVCKLCGSKRIETVVFVYPWAEERKRFCKDCHATYDSNFEIESVRFNQALPEA